MTENLSEGAKMLASLLSLSRNKYFYGKLLTERELTLEQCYMNRKRWLVNRLGLGSGVLCGLEVEVSQDGTCLVVHPGVAIDPLGREIIVPEPYCLTNPRQPNDCQGKPTGTLVNGAATLYLCLCYRECDSEPVPVLVSDCDTRQDCAANMVRERYCLRLCTEIVPGKGLPCADIFPLHPDPGFDHRLAAEKAVSGECAVPATECVVLADVLLPAESNGPVKVDMFAHREVLLSNATLFDLMMCMVGQVEACCQLKLLRYVSGDAQSGKADRVLRDPLVVQVVDGNNSPVGNEAVTFKVRGGDGHMAGGADVQTVNSDANGMAKMKWQLGPKAGLNTLEASIANGSNTVFTSLAWAVEVKPPVILKTNPSNGVSLKVNEHNKFLETGLEVVFNRNMNPDSLAAPEKWIAVWLVRGQKDDRGKPVSRTVRLTLKYHDLANGGPASDVFYRIDGWQRIFPEGILKKNFRVLVVAAAVSDNIVSIPDKVLLDADFKGTQLDFDQIGLFPKDPDLTLIEALQKMKPGDDWNFTEALFKGLSSTGVPPAIPSAGTGDGTPGGQFHSSFALY